MVAAAGADLVGADRFRHLRRWPFCVLRCGGAGAHLVRAFQPSHRDFARSHQASAVRCLLAAANRSCLRALACLHVGVWLRSRLQPEGRTHHDSAARHSAVDPGAQLPARRNAGDGGAVSASSAWGRDGRYPAHLHGSSVEHGFQLLLVPEEHSARHARSRQDLSLQLVSAVHPIRTALRRDRPGLELDDVRRRRLVLSDGLRDVRPRRPRFPLARTWFLPADRRQRRRHASHLLGRRSDDCGDRAARPDRVAAGNCLGRKVQDGAGGERRCTAFVVSQRD